MPRPGHPGLLTPCWADHWDPWLQKRKGTKKQRKPSHKDQPTAGLQIQSWITPNSPLAEDAFCSTSIPQPSLNSTAVKFYLGATTRPMTHELVRFTSSRHGRWLSTKHIRGPDVQSHDDIGDLRKRTKDVWLLSAAMLVRATSAETHPTAIQLKLCSESHEGT